MPVKIRRGGGGREALDARTDRQCDHVLFQPLVVADAGIAARSQHVHEAVLCDDLHPDTRMRGKEDRHDRRQHEARSADRHVQPKHAGHPVAQVVDRAQCRRDLLQGRGQPLDQPGSRFNRCDAARGPVAQPDAE